MVEGENYAQAELLESEWDGFANGIQVITTLYDPSYEVARSEVDYSDTPGVDKIYNGQITDVPAVEAKRECTVRIYIRLKETFSVQYDWLMNLPVTIRRTVKLESKAVRRTLLTQHIHPTRPFG